MVPLRSTPMLLLFCKMRDVVGFPLVLSLETVVPEFSDPLRQWKKQPQWSHAVSCERRQAMSLLFGLGVLVRWKSRNGVSP